MFKKISFVLLLLSFFIFDLSARQVSKKAIKPKQVENINSTKEAGIQQEVKGNNVNASTELKTIIGNIKISNKHIMGRIGDRVAAKRLTAMGYTKLRSKTTAIHGIDGIYIRKRSGKFEIIIVENKTNTSQLSFDSKGNKQMSDAWVKTKIKEMIINKNQRTRNTGLMLQSYYKNNPRCIEKQLWNYDLATGRTEVWILDKKADYLSSKPKWVWGKDKILVNILNRIKNGGVQ
jgi:hypothetical protein